MILGVRLYNGPQTVTIVSELPKRYSAGELIVNYCTNQATALKKAKSTQDNASCPRKNGFCWHQVNYHEKVKLILVT